ncbi:MAG: response regulator transcription factor [Bacteroidota bacterium]
MQHIIDQLYGFLALGKHSMFFYFTVSYSIGFPSLIVLILAQMKSQRKALVYMTYILLAGTVELILKTYLEYQRINLPYGVRTCEIVLIFTLQSLVIILLPLLVNELFAITCRRQINYIFSVLFGIGLALIIVPYFLGIYRNGTAPAFLGERISIEALTSYKIYRMLLWSAYVYALFVVIFKIKTVNNLKDRIFYIGSFAIFFLIFFHTAIPVFKTFPENLFISATGNFFLNIIVLKYIVDRFFGDVDLPPQATSSSGTAATLQLTDREKEVLALLRQGYTNKNIGTLLCISETTVKTHIQNIYKKVGVNNRVQLINSLTNYL